MSPRPLHVVFGAGQIGAPLARQLIEQGCDVRVVRRAGAADAGAMVVLGDAGDPEFASEAAKGAAVVYHCMNPAYDARVWARELPRIMRSLITAAGHAGARLVVLDNLYMLGRIGDVVVNEDTPANPVSPKGEIRAKVAEMLFAAHRRGDVRAVCGRASDFYGPGGVNTYFERRFWTRAFAGQSAQFFSDPDIPHTWHYTRDVAAGLAALGLGGDNVTGGWWMLPAEPAVSPRDLVGRFAKALGRDVPVEQIPELMVTILGWFMPIVRELKEMRYEWTAPLRVDDRRFRERFGLAPTPLDQGAAETVAWAKTAFGGGPR